MRVLFCCRPAYGHVYPLLPLAVACRDAGHDVLFGTGEGFVKRLEGLGFEAERVGISIPEADERVLRERPELNGLPREERLRIGVAVFGELLPRHTIEYLLPLLPRAAPDLVVYDETDAGAPIAAAIAGISATAQIRLGRQLPEIVRRAVLAAASRGLACARSGRQPRTTSSPPTRTSTSAHRACRTPTRPTRASGSSCARSRRSIWAWNCPAG